MYYTELRHILKEKINWQIRVNIEAYSIEDNGRLQFNVYVYNIQDGIIIDYLTGDSKLAN